MWKPLTAACLQTHLVSCRQEKRVIIIIIHAVGKWQRTLFSGGEIRAREADHADRKMLRMLLAL